MRYARGHKDTTRRRIIETAGRRLKRQGLDGSGVAALMADAGLTNGAFYAHFASKEDLIATVIAEELHDQRAQFSDRLSGGTTFEQLVREYLSAAHRDHPGEGCPSAALIDEVGRAPESVRQAYTDAIMPIVDMIAARIRPRTAASHRAQALGVLAHMVGTLQLARAITDSDLSDQLLATGIEQTLVLLRSTKT